MMGETRGPKVVYWSNLPSHYVSGRLNAVAARGNVCLEGWFNMRRAPRRSWQIDEREWLFKHRYIDPIAGAGRGLHIPFQELREVEPALLISLYAEPSFVAGTLAAKSMGTRTAFRVLPTFDAWTPRSPLKETTKHVLFRSVDSVKVPAQMGSTVARRYGVPTNRIFPVMQSIDVEHYASARDLNPSARERERLRLGIHGCVFLYVGRLWSGKGMDTLLDAYDEVKRECSDVSLLLVGDGIDEARYRERARSMPGVVFAGFVQPAELPSTYALADVFVFPTLGDPHGLVVEEAMAAGLPVISSEAAGEIRARLPEGRAGYIVPPARADQLAARMLRLARDARLRRDFAQVAASLVTRRTHEQYAVDFERFVEGTLVLPKRQNPATFLASLAGRPIGLALRPRTATGSSSQ